MIWDGVLGISEGVIADQQGTIYKTARGGLDFKCVWYFGWCILYLRRCIC